MLPPKDVPDNLGYHDYVRLNLRYMALSWHRQAAEATRQSLLHNPGAKDDPNLKKLSLAFQALDKALLVGEFSLEVQDTTGKLLSLTLEKTDRTLDRFEPVKKAKDGLKAAFSVLTSTVSDTIDNTIDEQLMPALGMPLDYLPEGKSAREYYQLSLRYEQLGAPEAAREALLRARDQADGEGDPEIANMAKRGLISRIPRHKVPPEACKKYAASVRSVLLNKPQYTVAMQEELVRNYPSFDWPYAYLANHALRKGDPEKAKILVKQALEVNPNSSRVLHARALINLAEWRIPAFDSTLETLKRLDPDSRVVNHLDQIKLIIDQNGLR